MNKQDYRDYQKRVASFFEHEHLANLSSGRITCERCKTKLNNEEDFSFCPNNECLDFKRRIIDEPFFSWGRCDCCKTKLGGNRVDASGYDILNKEAREFVVCEDCIYYAEYGCLDDATMLAIGTK